MRNFWLLLFASLAGSLLLVWGWRKMNADILHMPGREEGPQAQPARLHRGLLALLAAVLLALVANLVVLVKVASLFGELSSTRSEESSHQRLIEAMQERSMANGPLILVEQERMLKHLQGLAKGK